jgi:ADP-heptose:LPS heptosyltransferase
LTKAVPYDEMRSEAECFLDLGRAIGVDSADARPHLDVLPEERNAGAFPEEGDWVGVQPGARSPWKQIPLKTLAELVAELRNDGFRIALLGGADEEADAAEFSKMVGGETLNLVGKCELRQTMGVLTNLRVLVGSDTGLMHVAAAVGCPTLTVFGVVPASKWGHNYEPHIAIQAPQKDLAQVEPAAMLEAARSIMRQRSRQGGPSAAPSAENS